MNNVNAAKPKQADYDNDFSCESCGRPCTAATSYYDRTSGELRCGPCAGVQAALRPEPKLAGAAEIPCDRCGKPFPSGRDEGATTCRDCRYSMKASSPKLPQSGFSSETDLVPLLPGRNLPAVSVLTGTKNPTAQLGFAGKGVKFADEDTSALQWEGMDGKDRMRILVSALSMSGPTPEVQKYSETKYLHQLPAGIASAIKVWLTRYGAGMKATVAASPTLANGIRPAPGMTVKPQKCGECGEPYDSSVPGSFIDDTGYPVCANCAKELGMKAAGAGDIGYEGYVRQYEALLKQMLKYKPNEVGVGVYAEKLSDLEESWPEYAERYDRLHASAKSMKAAGEPDGTIEVKGRKGMNSTPFRKIFADQETFDRWLEKNGDDVTIDAVRHGGEMKAETRTPVREAPKMTGATKDLQGYYVEQDPDGSWTVFSPGGKNVGQGYRSRQDAEDSLARALAKG